MATDGIWIFVDDKKDEASAFAAELARSGLIKVEVLWPAEAREQLLQKMRNPEGVLMDVDLSAIAGEFGTGPGLAQDVRTKQKAKGACEFPIVRFSAAEPLSKNVFGDPSSEDLFELKILKDDVKNCRDEVISQLVGLSEVYAALIELSATPVSAELALQELFGVDQEVFSRWGHDGLSAKILTGARHAAHVAAGAFCRLFLAPYGLLIDIRLLAIRLGVDLNASGKSWDGLLPLLEQAKYRGVAHSHFPRWWARGVEEWWYKSIDKSGPLAGKTAAQRVELLTKSTGIEGLAALQGPAGEPTFRPWRFCRLGLEESPVTYLPVDPANSVRLTTQSDFPSWIEPNCASLKLALRARDDHRLNQKDIERLRQKHKV